MHLNNMKQLFIYISAQNVIIKLENKRLKIEFYDNYIKLLGVDIIQMFYDYEEQQWGTLLDMNEIEYLKIEPMKEESGE